MALRRRTLLQAAALLAFTSPVASSAASGPDLRVVLADDSPAEQEILKALQRRLKGLSANRDITALARRAGPAAYIAIGPSALQSALGVRLQGPLISTFTSRQTYTRLLAESDAATRTGVTAIYAEPSPAQQMELISAIFVRRVTVGALYSEQSAYMAPLLTQAAREHGLDLDLQLVAANADMSRALTRLQSATVLLIFPDAALYTPQSLRQLLESTYRRRQPVIGFSAGLVAAGTLASAYTDIDDTVFQLDMLVEAAADGRMPEPAYPRYWRVAINDNVARSLDLVVDGSVRALGARPA